jgi:hypothetical protein
LRTIRIALITGAIIAAMTALGAWSTTSRAPSPASSSSASASPGACGPWSQQGSADATAIVSTRTIRNCLRVGSDWVIATTGGPADAANLGILMCGSNSVCMRGQADPAPFDRWQWFKPSGIVGGVTILGVDGSALLLDAGGHELTFSLTSERFAAATGALS